VKQMGNMWAECCLSIIFFYSLGCSRVEGKQIIWVIFLVLFSRVRYFLDQDSRNFGLPISKTGDNKLKYLQLEKCIAACGDWLCLCCLAHVLLHMRSTWNLELLIR
jgi:hypothetical protein